MPTFGYQHVSPLKDDNILIESIEKVSAFSTRRLGVRVELGFEKFITPRLALNAGVLYYQRKQTIGYLYRDTENFEIDPLYSDSLVYRVAMTQQTGTFEYELKNIGVLGGINYTLKGKRFVQKFGLAAEFHKGLMPVSTEVASGSQYYMFGNVYYRISYPLSKRFDVMLQPTLNYSLQTDERITAPFYVKPYGLGFNFGFYFHF
jgi:hypothetical protein